MSEYIRRNVLGVVAIFIALGGTAFALPGKNSVDSGDIKKGQVKTRSLGKAAVTEPKLADGAVTNPKLADGAVTNPKLAPDAVDGTKVAADALGGADIDEASLEIPQPVLPTTLPPSGGAGGDLSGTYPDPQVQESGLALGGDLGGTAAAAQIGAGAVGDAELVDRTRSLVFPAAELADGAINLPSQAEPAIAFNGSMPALAFADGVFTDIAVNPVVPADRVPGSDFEARILWTVANQPPAGAGDVIWRAEALGVGLGEPVDDVFDPQVEAAAQDAGTADDLQIQTIELPGDEVQNGEMLLLRIMRMAGAGAGFADDDLAQDALLHAVELRYPAVR